MKYSVYHRHRCLFCQSQPTPAYALCAFCYQHCQRRPHVCRQCARPLPLSQQQCGQCLQSPPPWSRLIAPFYYTHIITHMISQFKYHHAHHFGIWLTAQLGHSLRLSSAPWPQALIPTPLHPQRLAARGFNQTFIIAQHLSRSLGIPINPDCCQRSTPTLTQVNLSYRNRQKNLQAAFVSTQPCPPHIAIIDDVVTTGSTARAMTQCLQNNGAKQIEIWCLATTQHTANT